VLGPFAPLYDLQLLAELSPQVEAALKGINWKKDRGLVGMFGLRLHYFTANFGEVDFKIFCICKKGKDSVLNLARAQKVQLPDVEDKKKASGGQETQDEKRTCQVRKAKGGTGKKKAAALMATGGKFYLRNTEKATRA
jgi:hypothetical protein